MFSSLSSLVPKILKRRRQRYIKHSNVDSVLPRLTSDHGDDKFKALSAQFRVDEISATSPAISDLRHAPLQITLCPSEGKVKDRCILGGLSLPEQTSHSLLSSVECVAKVLTTSPRDSVIEDTEDVVLEYSTVSLEDATSDEETSTLLPISTPPKLPSALPLTSALKSTTGSEPGTSVSKIILDPIANDTASGSFDHLASILPLRPTSGSPLITEILSLFDPLYTGSLSLDLEMSPARQYHDFFTHQKDSEDNVLVILEEEKSMMNCLESGLDKDPASSDSYSKATINPENCPSNKKSSFFDKSSCSIIDTLETVVAPSAAKSVSFEPPLRLLGGMLSKWTHDSVKRYEDGDIIYRKRIQDHCIVEWRRYRVKLRDFSGNRHEYVIVKLEHVKSKETHFIRFERWRRDRYITFDGKSGRTIDWSPDLDQVTILADWVASDEEKDTLVDKRVFGEDEHRLNLLDIYLVARSILQIPGNSVELAGRSSHWFAVMFSNVLDQDVDKIERKYSFKRGRLALIRWLRESSREERDYALMMIRGFRSELAAERTKYCVSAFNFFATKDSHGDNGDIFLD